MGEASIVDVVSSLRRLIEGNYAEDSQEVRLLHTLIRAYVRLQKKQVEQQQELQEVQEHQGAYEDELNATREQVVGLQDQLDEAREQLQQARLEAAEARAASEDQADNGELQDDLEAAREEAESLREQLDQARELLKRARQEFAEAQASSDTSGDAELEAELSVARRETNALRRQLEKTQAKLDKAERNRDAQGKLEAANQKIAQLRADLEEALEIAEQARAMAQEQQVEVAVGEVVEAEIGLPELLDWCKEHPDHTLAVRGRPWGYAVTLNRSGTVHQQLIKYQPEENSNLLEMVTEAAEELDKRTDTIRRPGAAPQVKNVSKTPQTLRKPIAPVATPRPQPRPKVEYPPELQALIDKIESQNQSGEQ